MADWSYEFAAVKTPKGLVFSSRDFYERAIAQLGDGEAVTVKVSKQVDKRSVRQNKWIWGVAYPLIAEHLGYDAHEHEQLHYDLLSVRFGTHAIQPKIPGAPPRIEPVRTSSQLTVTEFSDYMEWLCRYAAQEFDVVLPLPDETLMGAR